VNKLKQVYAHFNDVDLSVGGALEEIKDTDAGQGPTFSCIFNIQFYNTRKGDRFFFENDGELAFSKKQLKSIRDVTLASIICKNSENVQTVQPDVFNLVSSGKANGNEKKKDVNEIVSCSLIPALNIALWKQ
jgi:peroxidase